MKAPCHKCEERHIGCHSECERYQRWSDARKEANERRYKEASLCDRSNAQKAIEGKRQRAERVGRRHWF